MAMIDFICLTFLAGDLAGTLFLFFETSEQLTATQPQVLGFNCPDYRSCLAIDNSVFDGVGEAPAARRFLVRRAVRNNPDLKPT